MLVCRCSMCSRCAPTLLPPQCLAVVRELCSFLSPPFFTPALRRAWCRCMRRRCWCMGCRTTPGGRYGCVPAAPLSAVPKAACATTRSPCAARPLRSPTTTRRCSTVVPLLRPSAQYCCLDVAPPPPLHLLPPPFTPLRVLTTTVRDWQIEKDLLRTFPTNIFFATTDSPGIPRCVSQAHLRPAWCLSDTGTAACGICQNACCMSAYDVASLPPHADPMLTD